MKNWTNPEPQLAKQIMLPIIFFFTLATASLYILFVSNAITISHVHSFEFIQLNWTRQMQLDQS